MLQKHIQIIPNEKGLITPYLEYVKIDSCPITLQKDGICFPGAWEHWTIYEWMCARKYMKRVKPSKTTDFSLNRQATFL